MQISHRVKQFSDLPQQTLSLILKKVIFDFTQYPRQASVQRLENLSRAALQKAWSRPSDIINLNQKMPESSTMSILSRESCTCLLISLKKRIAIACSGFKRNLPSRHKTLVLSTDSCRQIILPNLGGRWLLQLWKTLGKIALQRKWLTAPFHCQGDLGTDPLSQGPTSVWLWWNPDAVYNGSNAKCWGCLWLCEFCLCLGARKSGQQASWECGCHSHPNLDAL